MMDVYEVHEDFKASGSSIVYLFNIVYIYLYLFHLLKSTVFLLKVLVCCFAFWRFSLHFPWAAFQLFWISTYDIIILRLCFIPILSFI